MAGEHDKWEMYQDKRGEHRWRRRAANGTVVGASCEGFVQKSSCRHNAQRHGMDGNPKNLGDKDKWEIYQDKRNQYRWRRKALNGEVVGCSHEGYDLRIWCNNNAERNGL